MGGFVVKYECVRVRAYLHMRKMVVTDISKMIKMIFIQTGDGLDIPMIIKCSRYITEYGLIWMLSLISDVIY
jgi:hypothetical protein